MLVRLNPEANVWQTGVKAERGERSHDHLKDLDTEEGHEIAWTMFEHAVDEHDRDESRENGDHKRHGLVFRPS